jgi:hypothetical protein
LGVLRPPQQHVPGYRTLDTRLETTVSIEKNDRDPSR